MKSLAAWGLRLKDGVMGIVHLKYTQKLSSVLSKSNEEMVVKYGCCTVPYARGADTVSSKIDSTLRQFYINRSIPYKTVSTLTSFFIVIALNSDVQRKAQDEIDRVIDTSRLPTLADRKTKSYLDALVKEVLRGHPVHAPGDDTWAVKDDVYIGYLIPKDANLVPNVW